ncbi:hypothetical protein K7711_07625 [Nocardia sp. CA2R105]|uniref:DUF7683 domain-containing protein n=1 Tax=Nocardia coffeae TaxID=2873381 RepID=UPI001CA73747|nr:hypothetical protein [Nocardia coffeae]MBY8856340.1 hypothetical protein [Nocardia coffeae]
MRLEVTVFDRESDQLVSEIDVTSIEPTFACELLGIPFENLVYVNELTADQLRSISQRAGIDIPFDSSKSYFLEPEAEFDGETWPPKPEQPEE